MESDDDDFFGLQPSSSGVVLSHMNTKSSVLCPESQNITSQYLVLQQIDAHQKMISRAKGRVDTTPPKSMNSYISVSSQKKKLLRQFNTESKNLLQNGFSEIEPRQPLSSRLTVHNAEEDEVGSTNAPNVHKGIQAGIPVSGYTSKTAEKISWYLEALSLGELQSQYFTHMDGRQSFNSQELYSRSTPNPKAKKKIIKGDLLDWHKKHFVEPAKQFSPRILAGTNSRSKVREMRCYNPPFRKMKKKSAESQSSDTFESLDEDEKEDEGSESGEDNNAKSDNSSSIEEESHLNGKHSTSDFPPASSIPAPLHLRKKSHHIAQIKHKNEEEKCLDFLSKVTEDILKSGFYTDKAIQQAFEFHLQFYKDDPIKERLQKLLQQMMESLKIGEEERLVDPINLPFVHSRPITPPEKEISTSGFSSDTLKIPAEFNSSIASELVNNPDEPKLNDS